MMKLSKEAYTNINSLQRGGGGMPAPPQGGQLDLQSLTPEMVIELQQSGVPPEQLASMAMEQGQPVPPAVQMVLQETSRLNPQQQIPMQQQGPPPQQGPSKAKGYPAQMDLKTYAEYSKAEKAERKNKPQKRASLYGYVFSDLLREDIVRDMKRTQGSFLVGVNLTNLFKEFRRVITSDKTLKEMENQKKEKGKDDSDEIFRKVGEFVDVDYDKILEKKLGYRNDSDVPLLPEMKLDRTSTFDQIIDESKHYADIGYKGKITPYGLLIMTRLLYKYKKNTAQWLRVATVLELIYKYLSNGQSKQNFFNNKDEIPILSLMDLEEFYNTDHIFMTENELNAFKKNLEYYKYDIEKHIEKRIDKISNVVENLNKK